MVCHFLAGPAILLLVYAVPSGCSDGNTAKEDDWKPSQPSRFPYVISVSQGHHTCPGGLIGPRLVLTSSLCIHGIDRPHIELGGPTGWQEIGVDHIFLEPTVRQLVVLRLTDAIDAVFPTLCTDTFSNSSTSFYPNMRGRTMIWDNEDRSLWAANFTIVNKVACTAEGMDMKHSFCVHSWHTSKQSDLIGAPFIISDPEGVDMAGLDMMVGMVSAEFWSSSKGHFLRCELISNSPIKEWLEAIKDQSSDASSAGSPLPHIEFYVTMLIEVAHDYLKEAFSAFDGPAVEAVFWAIEIIIDRIVTAVAWIWETLFLTLRGI